MIDSVVIQINDLRKYSKLVDFVYKEHVEGKEKRRKVLEGSYDPRRENTIYMYHLNHADGYTKRQGYSFFLKSFHYNVAGYINDDRDLIEFNFSLPKYIFGTNVHQLVPHYYDLYKEEYQSKPFYELAQYHFMHFKSAFNWFLEKEFIDIYIDKNDVRIKQIDYCFNMMFNSPYDIKEYFVYLRKVRKKYFRDTTKVATNYFNGIHYPSGTHTLKIYHKGPEFRHSHKGAGGSNYNKVKKRQGKEAADKLSNIADNMLRFEVSFKPEYLSDVYLRHLAPSFVKECRKKHVKNTAHGYLNLNDIIIPYVDLPRVEKEKIQIGKFLDSRKVRVMLRSDEADNFKMDRFNYREYPFETSFTFSMFEHLLKKFHQILDQYYVGSYVGTDTIVRRVFDQRLEKALKVNKFKPKDRITESMVKKLHGLLREYSWDEIKDLRAVSDRTFYKYKKFFKEQGFGEVSSQEIFNLDLTYQRYYEVMAPYFDKISVRKSLPFRF